MKMNNKGFTLVEVMAGFTLLVVLMVSFVKIINLSSDLTTAAVDAKNKTLDFYEKYYNGKNYYTNQNNNNDPAFRTSKALANDTVMENGAAMKVFIKEIPSLDYEESISSGEVEPEVNAGTLSGFKEYQLSNVKIKMIENLKDKFISKIIVFRYVRD